jgi:hypothetical protein
MSRIPVILPGGGDRPPGAASRHAVGTISAAAYDQVLARRIRQLIGSDPELTEKKMVGGLAFLICGNMATAARAAPWSASTPHSQTPWWPRPRPRS